MRTVHIKMNVYNAFRECNEVDEGNLRNTDPQVHRLLIPLFVELSKKRPAWKYVCKGYGDMDPTGSFYLYNRFTIIEDDEELGTVWASKNWRTGEPRYAFDSPRLRAARSRGNCTETKDIKKATKLILANMYALTLPELMLKAANEARGKASTVLYAVDREYHNLRDRLLPNIMSFVMDNHEAFERYNTYSLKDKQDLRDKFAAAQRAAVSRWMVSNKEDVLVVERGGKLHVEYTNDPGVYHSYTLDELPARLKEAVAVLKLCEQDKLVDGIGIRTDTNTFLILNGEDNA